MKISFSHFRVVKKTSLSYIKVEKFNKSKFHYRMESKAKEIIKKDNLQEDLVAQGFHKLDDNLVVRRPPKINWGRLYQDFTDAEKVEYLQKLASTMNHAAHLIQGERDELNKLCELKEQQIIKLREAMDQNLAMLQSEVTKINEERQSFNKAYVELKQELKRWQSSRE